MRRSRVLRAARAGLYLLAVAHLVEALLLRRRHQQLLRLAGDDEVSEVGVEELDVVQVEGAVVDDRTLGAVAREMQRRQVEVVDLVPGDLPPHRMLRLLRRVEPARVHEDPLYARGGAHQVVVRHRSIASRMGERSGDLGARSDASRRLDHGDLVRESMAAQRYAPTTSVLRIAPHLRTVPADGHERWRELQELTAWTMPRVFLAPGLVALETVHLAALTAGLLVAPVPAALALASWSAQPSVALGARSRDVRRSSLFRLPAAWATNLGTLVAGWRATQVPAAEADLAPSGSPSPPTTELFDPRREQCPWCGAGTLVGRLDTTDLLHYKPGSFHLDRCTECGHIFQNPPLSIRGLDHYYDQFYDGQGEEATEVIFAGMAAPYRRRAEAVTQFVEPTAWLDVGTGHGHFCLATRQRWPACRFDGLDLSETVEEAGRRGWVDEAYRGLFPELADGMVRSYDVVSMHHYLEHTREPRGELDAAAKVLRPGGYLSIEVPDPASPWSRRLGRYWLPWFQPQHQHLVPCENLVTGLAEAGFEVVAVERGPATMGGDLVMGGVAFLQSRFPSPHVPWTPPDSASRQVARVAATAVAIPFLAAAAAVDEARDAWLRRPGSSGIGNAYRIVARRL